MTLVPEGGAIISTTDVALSVFISLLVIVAVPPLPPEYADALKVPVSIRPAAL